MAEQKCIAAQGLCGDQTSSLIIDDKLKTLITGKNLNNLRPLPSVVGFVLKQ